MQSTHITNKLKELKMTSKFEDIIRGRVGKTNSTWARSRDTVLARYGKEVVLKRKKPQEKDITMADIYSVFNSLINDVKNRIEIDQDLSADEALREVEEGI